MSDRLDDSISPADRFVLSALATFERHDRTPVRTDEVRRLCRACTPSDELQIVGTVSEADVMRSLYHLETTSLVREVELDATSPVGKGRPAYDLRIDEAELVERTDTELPSIDVPDAFWRE